MDDKVRGVLRRQTGAYRFESSELVATKRYLAFLARLGVPDLDINKIAHCGRWRLRAECRTSPKHHGLKTWRCRLPMCPCCSYLNYRGQTEDMVFVMERVLDAAGMPFQVWGVDFTLGSDLWAKVPRDRLYRLAGIAYRATRRTLSQVFGFPVEIFFDASPQSWHSGDRVSKWETLPEEKQKTPFDGFYPHVHANVPRLFWDKRSGRLLTNRGRFGSLKLKYIPHDLLKENWRYAVEKAYGKSRALVAASERYFDVHLSYVTWRGHPRVNKGLDKRLRYCYRGPQKDVQEVLEQQLTPKGLMEWDKPWSKDWMVWLLMHRQKRHQGYGLASGSYLKKGSLFMRALGLSLGTRNERDKERHRNHCPFCRHEGLESEVDIDWRQVPMSESEAAASRLYQWGNHWEDEKQKWVAYA